MRLFDILGPVMVGPSSSHTAGAVRIGLTARKLLGDRPVCNEGRNHDVLQGGELREKLVELEDETEMLVAEIAVLRAAIRALGNATLLAYANKKIEECCRRSCIGTYIPGRFQSCSHKHSHFPLTT